MNDGCFRLIKAFSSYVVLIGITTRGDGICGALGGAGWGFGSWVEGVLAGVTGSGSGSS